MVKMAVETYGRIDILFNNAGIAGSPVRLAELSVEDWDRVIDINLKGVFLGSKYTIPVMLEQGKGVIINNASSSGITPIPRVSVYAAAKAGVIQLTKAMAIEYGGDNIRVNCICPGFIDTPMTSIIIPPDSESRDYSHLWPLTKPGNPEDIAKAALYLASDDSSFVTGTSLVRTSRKPLCIWLPMIPHLLPGHRWWLMGDGWPALGCLFPEEVKLM